MHTLVVLAALLVVGFLGARLSGLVKLPSVTGYLLAGLLIGPSVLNLVGDSDVQGMAILNDIALAFIAFSIGSEFNLRQLRKLGSRIIVITLLEALGAVILVEGVMLLVFHQSLAVSLVLGGIAAATAPAATIMVVRQYRAAGPLTDTLLPVVAIDDAVCIVAFGVNSALVRILTGRAAGSWVALLAQPLWEIGGSLILGFVVGVGLCSLHRLARDADEDLAIVIGFVLLSAGSATMLHTSPLLTTMVAGATVVNLLQEGQRVLALTDRVSHPIFALFFVLAGASLHLGYLRHVGAIGIGYIVARALGKMLGAGLGSMMTKSPSAVTKYLGLALIPQAGVAIGLSILASQAFPELATTLTTIILASVVVYELVGPVLAKIAITRAGEVGGRDRALAS